MRTFLLSVGLILVITLVALACGGDSAESPSPTLPPPTPTQATSPTPTLAPTATPTPTAVSTPTPPSLAVILASIAERYSPVLFLHPNEFFEPKDVDVLLDRVVLADYALGVVNQDPDSVRDMLHSGDAGAEDLSARYDAQLPYLDVPTVDLAPVLATADEAKIQETAQGYVVLYSTIAADYPARVYVRLTSPGPNTTVVQYWFFYFVNLSRNVHEGDWELVQIVFDSENLEAIGRGLIEPSSVSYSVHGDGITVPWAQAQKIESTHPRVLVALGSHANYFTPIEDFGELLDKANADGDALAHGSLVSQVSAKGQVRSYELELLETQGWLSFPGRWGEMVTDQPWPPDLRAIFNGPTAPAFQDPWTAPIEWQVPASVPGSGQD